MFPANIASFPLVFLLRKTPNFDESFDTEKLKDAAADFKRIRCPHCRWQPQASSLWYCGDCPYPEFFFGGCGTGWNTFATAGKCPGCLHRWKWTLCLRCNEWARHEDWYESEDK